MKKNDLLLIIDMQNVYLPGNHWGCPAMPEAIRNICTILDADVVRHVMFTRFVPPSPAVGTWKDYNAENAVINADPYLNELAAELRSYTEKYPVYDKSIYSSCRIPQVTEIMKRADRIVLAGVVAECCVLSTLMEAIDNGYKTVYLTDCVAGETPRNEESIRRIAAGLAPVHTQVMSSKEYLAE